MNCGPIQASATLQRVDVGLPTYELETSRSIAAEAHWKVPALRACSLGGRL
ncbi:MAG: hypothetical protein ACXWYS_04820 [Gaiellaceae bacterium]